MTVPSQESQAEVANIAKQNDKEINFRKQEAMYMRQLDQQRQETENLKRELEASRKPIHQEEDDDSEPYVDRKKLDKTLAKFGQQQTQQTQTEIQKAVNMALKDERKQNWIKSNPDFYEVLQNADKFAERDPELAEAILEMPDTFERQKLVYKNIKALGVHKPEQKQSTIQEKVDANKRSPYYSPSGINAAPYAAVGDYSPSGQKNAYDKMKQLQSQLRL